MEEGKGGEGGVEISVNGDRRTICQGKSVMQLIEELGLEPGRIAIEFNLEILPRPRWPSTLLEADSRVEIVHFVGGG